MFMYMTYELLPWDEYEQHSDYGHQSHMQMSIHFMHIHDKATAVALADIINNTCCKYMALSMLTF